MRASTMDMDRKRGSRMTLKTGLKKKFDLQFILSIIIIYLLVSSFCFLFFLFFVLFDLLLLIFSIIICLIWIKI